MASTTAKEGAAMTTTNTTTDDLYGAIACLAMYEGESDGTWESLGRAAQFIANEIISREAKALERDYIRTNVPAGRKLTAEGLKQVRAACRRIASDDVNKWLREQGNCTNNSIAPGFTWGDA
jgi:hypothetical protein